MTGTTHRWFPGPELDLPMICSRQLSHITVLGILCKGCLHQSLAPHVMGRVHGGELHRPVCYVTHHAVLSAAKAQVVVFITSQQVPNSQLTDTRWFPGPELDLLNTSIGQCFLELITVLTFREFIHHSLIYTSSPRSNESSTWE